MSSNTCTSGVCKLTEHRCNTDIQLHQVKYVWTINKFDFHEAIGTNIISPEFSAITNPQVKWFLKVKPNGKTDAKDEVSFYVCLGSDDVSKKIFAKICTSVLNQEQTMGCSAASIANASIHEFSAVPGDETKNWGWPKFLQKNENFRNTILVDQKLVITCTILFSAVSEAFPVSNVSHQCDVTPLYPELPMCNLAENFGKLLENHKLSDIVLSVKNREYPAHKTILAARSSVFAAMFEHNFEENQTSRIEIEDMNEEVVAEMLRYIYTGKCENVEKLADGLLAAADKYDLNQLKMICAEALIKTLSVDNALNILVLADLHSIRELKSEVIKFIVARFAEVVMSMAWKNILVSNPELIDEVCKTVVSRSTEPNKKKSEDTSSEVKQNRSE